MKITQEEQIKAIKDMLKSFKAEGTKLTRAELMAIYTCHVTYLLKVLAKAGKEIRLGDTKIKA